MKSKAVSEIMLTLLFIGTLTFAFDIQTVKAGSKTWYVDDDGGADFKIIQDAINAASPGDTIVVLRGYYTESQVRVNKTLTLIAIGKVIVDGLQQGRWVFAITSDGTVLRGFTVTNSSGLWDGWGSAIFVSADYCRIESNTVINNPGYGIFVMGFHNVVKGNTVSANRFGIIVAGSPCAIRSKFNVVEKNIVTDNEVMGIYFAWYADNNICERNFVQSNSIGIILFYASFNNVTHNLIIRNDYGIQAAYSEYNCVEKNVVERNDYGIEITAFSQWNSIKRNVAILNRNYGIGVTGANTHFNTIARNVVLLNAEFDLYWDGEGTGNIWTKNKYRTKNW